jgi:hypothetical protein
LARGDSRLLRHRRGSNRGTEAINGVIEKTRRLAYGFRNSTNYRLRILPVADDTRPYGRHTPGSQPCCIPKTLQNPSTPASCSRGNRGWMRRVTLRDMSMLCVVAIDVCSFVLLTVPRRAHEEVTRTVDANYRSSYDILVRPQGSWTSIEATEGTVRRITGSSRRIHWCFQVVRSPSSRTLARLVPNIRFAICADVEASCVPGGSKVGAGPIACHESFQVAQCWFGQKVG